MLFRRSMSIAQQLMPIYNTTLHKNKTNVALNLMWLTVCCYETPTGHKGGTIINERFNNNEIMFKNC